MVKPRVGSSPLGGWTLVCVQAQNHHGAMGSSDPTCLHLLIGFLIQN